MKYSFLKISIAAGIVITAGCKKSFLDVPPQGELTEELALTDPDAAEKMVGGVYNTLYFGGFGRTTVGFLWEISNDIASDDADKGSTPGDFNVNGVGDIDNFVHTPTNSIFNNIWLGHYSAITTANKAIEILTESSIDDLRKNRLLGESRFLRALYYFNLVRYFGGVPKIDRVLTPEEANSDAAQTRASKEEIYALIVSDLEFAAANLPLKGEQGAIVGRATKGAAQAYLAKVYLYMKNYQKAFDNAQAVISSNKYALVTNYGTIFRERPAGGAVPGGNNNAESIFEVQTGPNAGQNAVSPLFSNGQGPRGKGGWNDLGFGFNSPTSDLVGTYETGDTRREGSIIFINPTVAGNSTGTVLWDGFRIPSKDSVENDRYSYKAYHSPIAESPQLSGSKDNKPKNIRLMRYAEVLLIYAEAAANLGNTGEATAKLNMVRARANLAPSTGTIANIWNERRVELALEADRFLDLVRQGRAGQVLRAHGKNFVNGKHEVFPIPQPQRDLSGGRLTQNPGY
jgi:starch-binding outer membrane protein, SusD/RagB family